MYSNISAADILLCEVSLEIEEWNIFALSKPFVACIKHNDGPQFNF